MKSPPKGPPPKIRPIEGRDAGLYAEYVQIHMAQSGKDGMPIFAPTAGRPGREEIRDNARLRWARRLSDPNWGRAWVMEAKGAIVGHIELRGGRIPAELHRASLGMGMLQAYTGQGNGKRLMETAVIWAKAQPQLEWIDLGVFAGNEPAIKLYERFGFTREMVRLDAFRNEDGRPIDDIFMTLRLR